MVDNVSIHLYLYSKRAATCFNFEIYFLPSYSPNLSPVEIVFGKSKKAITKSLKSQEIDFSK